MEDSSIVAVAVLAAFGLTELLLRRDAMARRLRPDVSDRGTSYQILLSYVAAVVLLMLVASHRGDASPRAGALSLPASLSAV